jgi:hypothetical protein
VQVAKTRTAASKGAAVSFSERLSRITKDDHPEVKNTNDFGCGPSHNDVTPTS